MVFIVIHQFSSPKMKAGVHAREYLSLIEEVEFSCFRLRLNFGFLLSLGTAAPSGRMASKQAHLFSQMVESKRGNNILSLLVSSQFPVSDH